ncbi:MAG: antibiotic biosynthesis monooxygenase [Syntrophales bacterium]|nr:antibiotic biosynthesis monooxygenase [Syntrophales bacterium]
MAVKVFIRRQIPQGKEKEVLDLVKELRKLAVNQPGYISGETLVSADDPNKFLVISTWRSIEDWKSWQASPERTAKQSKIDEVTGNVTEYEVYHYLGEKLTATLRGFKGWEGG